MQTLKKHKKGLGFKISQFYKHIRFINADWVTMFVQSFIQIGQPTDKVIRYIYEDYVVTLAPYLLELTQTESV